jgi:2-polyprenyl-3-methyl-5-hydroxy-6-metoxy-1,4-benzoquinol methylase
VRWSSTATHRAFSGTGQPCFLCSSCTHSLQYSSQPDRRTSLNLTERTTGGLHEFVADRLTTLFPNRDARILDVGCGTGALLARLHTLGFKHLCGIDIDPPEALPGITFVPCDLDNFNTPLDAASVDLAVAVEVVEHVENIGGLLQELSRLLSPDGLILLTTPNVHSVEARLRFLLASHLKQFDAIGDPTHVTPIFLFPFTRILKRHGFSIIDASGYPQDGSSPTSRLSLRMLAKLARFFGAKDAPSGDTLYMLVGRSEDSGFSTNFETKRHDLTAHYKSN